VHTAAQRVRALVVEDSPSLRARISRVLSADPGIEVVGQAGDGALAIELCLDLLPDVITIGVTLSGLSAAAVTEHLMSRRPTPILVVSTPGRSDDLAAGLAAVTAGAIDVLHRPTSHRGQPSEWDAALVRTVKMVAKIRVVTHLRPRGPAAPVAGSVDRLPAQPCGPHPSAVAPPSRLHAPMPDPNPDHSPRISVLAIGASTGGPAAIATVLSGLPLDFGLPVLLVLHVGEQFGPSFASWLRDISGRRIRFATEGEPMAGGAGQVLIAPPGRHLVVRGGLLHLTHDPERHSCRPSVDVLFETLARDCGPRVAACLLTGMGRDGAAGLLEVHRAGGLTVAQDEASSVVFGMPGEAVRLGAAQHVLPADRIGALIGRLTGTAAEAR
jgi:two-component system chemotaxis response regulator CheB